MIVYNDEKKEQDTTAGDILIQILLNQREILHGLSAVITSLGEQSNPMSLYCNYDLISRYHETEDLLGLEREQRVEEGAFQKIKD